MDNIKLGKYRHFKGNLYEVIGIMLVVSRNAQKRSDKPL